MSAQRSASLRVVPRRSVLRLVRTAAAIGLAVGAASAPAEEVFINEFHYDNEGVDVGEAVEIAGPAGTDLARYRIVLYNGASGSPYDSVDLHGAVPDEDGSGAGAAAFPTPGLQNGAPDGIVLFDTVAGRVVQFLSYEGEFEAVSGVAAGLRSSDVGVSESGSVPAGQSLQLVGEGAAAGDFAWVGPRVASFGRLNAGQSLTATAVRSIRVFFSAPSVAESGGAGNVAELRVELVPPPDGESGPAAPLPIELASDPAGEIRIPAILWVGEDGSGAVEVSGLADGVPDGSRRVRVAAVDPSGAYRSGEAEIIVEDVDSPVLRFADLRVATYNLENGPGPEGSAKFTALAEVLRRIDADVIGFQEATEDADFRDLRALVRAIGIPDTAPHLAVAGDAFATEAYLGGDFPSNQNVALASRHPIREVAQIGRGSGDGSREMTRYPIFVVVDAPGVPDAEDPVFVVVHLKAGSDEADRFRKSVEGHRIAEFLAERGIHGGTDRHVFILGDFNEDIDDLQPARFSTGIDPATHLFPDGSLLPASYRLGDDLTGIEARTFDYAGFPATPFAALGLRVVDAVQLDGSDRTRTDGSPRRLDYLLAGGRAWEVGNVWAEVYNAALEKAGPGLPKDGAPPSQATSVTASDHHALFGDFELAVKPRLGVTIDQAFLYEDESTVVVGGVVRRMPTPSGPDSVLVDLGFGPWGEATIDRRMVELPPGFAETAFEIRALADGVPDPDRVMTVVAAAPGHSSGHASVIVRNVEPSGRAVIGRVHEPSLGNSPRALELHNASGEAIDFRIEPLVVRLFPNGDRRFQELARIHDGILPADGSLVIGDAESGQILVSRGIVPAPAAPFGTYPDGWLFPDATGAPKFFKTSPSFNGDDAIEVVVGAVRADVFGMIGDDPGSAWAGGGVLTRDTGLERHPFAWRGSAGFTDPSIRFVAVTPTPALVGFGTPLTRSDPFGDWLDANGISTGSPALDALTDGDRDGSPNLVEYGVGGDPRVADAGGVVELVRETDGSLRILVATPETERRGIEWTLEMSIDGATWTARPSNQGVRGTTDDGRPAIIWAVGPDDHLPAGAPRFVRVRIALL